MFLVRYVSGGLLFLKPLGTFLTMRRAVIFVNDIFVSAEWFSSALYAREFSILQHREVELAVYKTR